MLQDKASTGIALGFTLGTVMISVFQARPAGGCSVLVPAWSPTGRAHAVVTRAQICQHLRNYTQPSFQRYIIRIIFLASVPVACTCRGAQLVWPKPTLMLACTATGPMLLSGVMPGTALSPQFHVLRDAARLL